MLSSPQKDLITTEGLRLGEGVPNLPDRIIFPQKDLITTEGLRHELRGFSLFTNIGTPKRPDHHGGIETVQFLATLAGRCGHPKKT